VSRRPAAILLLALLALALLPGAQAAFAASSSAAAGTLPGANVKINVSKHVQILGKARVTGAVTPFVAGQKVLVTYYQSGNQAAQHSVKVHKSGAKGSFSDSFRVDQAGGYAVQATHKATATQGAGSSARKKFRVKLQGLHVGSHGPLVKQFKRGLKKMGYDSGGGSSYSDRTGREVLAYRKVNNMPHNFHAGPAIVQRVLAGKGGYHVRHPGAGNHAEVPLSKQVLVLTKGDKPYGIYPVSTGKPSTPTVTGHFQFYSTQPGYNSEGMYYSFYFHGGYAVHGYASVPPTYPASHGCVRTYIADQPRIFDQLRYGEDIFIF
jgi:L,D-transpeptidase catalytic domain